MTIYKLNTFIICTLSALLFHGCTETYPLLTNTYEEAIVVEATITNELKYQEIKITKTARFEDENYLPESGAEVFITDDAGNQYKFKEDSEKYVSITEFQAVPERKYQLHINTKDGKSFESSPEYLTAVSPIQSLTTAVEIKDKAKGIAIRVNSFDASAKSKYYKYEYEETYKVVAPKWSSIKVTLDENDRFVFSQNSTDKIVCYANKKNTELLLTDTNNLTEDRVDFMVRFIDKQDYITTTRYSILVKQYIISLASYSYNTTLKKMAGSGNILAPNQPGLLLGNLKSVNNPSNKIVGYFDVASVSSERIYFNHNDLFPNELPPPYIVDCDQFCYGGEGEVPVPCTHQLPLLDDFVFGLITFHSSGTSHIYWVNAPCGDCTKIASNIKPTFWVD